MSYFVYGLIDPRNGELRYVGEAKNMKNRLAKHMTPSQLIGFNHKKNWIKLLKTEGLKPEMIMLEEHPTLKSALEAEIDLVAYFKAIGCDLTNGTEGGEGNIPTEETKRKISQTLKGKYVGEKSANFGKKMPDEVKQK